MDFDNADGIYDSKCKNGIVVEPRLIEYMQKKKFYKENKINTIIPLEETYQITKTDLKKIQRFQKGENMDVYDEDLVRCSEDGTDEGLEFPDPQGFFFASRELKNDPRLVKLRQKLERDKELIKQRHNYSNFNFRDTKLEDQDEFSRKQFLETTKAAYDIENRNRDVYYPQIKPDDNECNIPHVTPKINYKTPLHNRQLRQKPSRSNNYNKCPPDNNNEFLGAPPNRNKKCDNSLTNIIGELDSYNEVLRENYQKASEIDEENNMFVPSINCKDKKYINTSQYQAVPFMGNKKIRNIEDENIIKCGIPNKDTKKKSYGYSNPAEHYFDYISEDIQEANHVVMPFPRGGTATRLDNHKTARPYYQREIM